MNQTIQIETDKSIRFENVASFRKKMKESEVELEVGRFVDYLKRGGAQKNGPMITATFGIEVTEEGKVLDMEFLVPIDRLLELPMEYSFKPIFHLVHAIYSRYIGDPLEIQNTYVKIVDYIKNNQLQQITAGYNVIINDEQVIYGETSIIDIYIGLNPSLL